MKWIFAMGAGVMLTAYSCEGTCFYHYMGKGYRGNLEEDCVKLCKHPGERAVAVYAGNGLRQSACACISDEDNSYIRPEDLFRLGHYNNTYRENCIKYEKERRIDGGASWNNG